MKASDFIVEFIINKGITDVFGYPGGMVTQLMDSFAKYSDRISAHVTYHEQGAAFAACGYAQTSGKPGVAYATSGPGATNLVTGIANAFFDSIPTIFITGQVNNNESKGNLRVRQRGFQETDIVSIVNSITKYAVYVEKVEDLPGELEKAYQVATQGRPGPVLLDIPMNIFKSEVDLTILKDSHNINAEQVVSSGFEAVKAKIVTHLEQSNSPVLLVGAGVKNSGYEVQIRNTAAGLGIPVISSMTAFDVMKDDPHYFGFIGAYGTRSANFIAAKSDLIISIGSRLDIRQVGFFREKFAPNAKIIRFDIDEGELEYKVHEDELQICAGLDIAAAALNEIKVDDRFESWLSNCKEMQNLLADIDANPIGRLIEDISHQIPDDVTITTDVGQNQVWIAQSFKVKSNQRVLFSGGHGAMGYSLPAAIGAYYGSGKKPVYCFVGDGGLQMNIQELQFVAREQLPVKIIVLNNNALGMIRHFQEMYFDGRYAQTKPTGGYSAPDFSKIAQAYGIASKKLQSTEEIIISDNEYPSEPELIEIMIREDTYVTPKLEFGKPNQDQEPLIDRDLYDKIMKM